MTLKQQSENKLVKNLYPEVIIIIIIIIGNRRTIRTEKCCMSIFCLSSVSL
jgi:hypothetical protein